MRRWFSWRVAAAKHEASFLLSSKAGMPSEAESADEPELCDQSNYDTSGGRVSSPVPFTSRGTVCGYKLLREIYVLFDSLKRKL